jgi:hypothetical protein
MDSLLVGVSGSVGVLNLPTLPPCAPSLQER